MMKTESHITFQSMQEVKLFIYSTVGKIRMKNIKKYSKNMGDDKNADQLSS